MIRGAQYIILRHDALILQLLDGVNKGPVVSVDRPLVTFGVLCGLFKAKFTQQLERSIFLPH